MSRRTADHLTPPVLARLARVDSFDGGDDAIVICSIDEQGWAHPAMLSHLEVVARDARTIRLSLYGASRTARHLHANGRLSIVLANETGVYYIKGEAGLKTPRMVSAPHLALFEVRVRSVLEDRPDAAETARLTTGLRIERPGLDAAAARRILAELAAD